MGCAITDLLVAKELSLEDLSGKILAVDAFNQLYMFLSTIRQRDGSLLMDSKGEITSHLSGLFFRFSKLMQSGLRFVFVFDGKVPDLKKKERQRRAKLKHEAQKEFEKAAAAEDVVGMRKYAARTSQLTSEMREEAILLIKAMGIPIVQAQGEGEAQAAYLVKKGQAYAIMSQDADSLLFGSPKVVKNLSVTKRKKQPSALAYQTITPEIISLQENLKVLGITNDQLICLGMLVGTDYNIGGIKGIGPKNALKLVKEYPHDFDKLFKEVKWDDQYEYSWKEVFSLFKDCPVSEEYALDWEAPDWDKVKEVLVEKHEFGLERVEEVRKSFEKAAQLTRQRGLGEFFR
ncbi:MAG: flap endonuclease-1 [Nanoarchaeota archaeon]